MVVWKVVVASDAVYVWIVAVLRTLMILFLILLLEMLETGGH